MISLWKKKSGNGTRQLQEKIGQLEESLSLLERQKLLALGVLESMNEAVIAIDSSEKVLLINQATEKLFKITAEKVMGKNFLEAIRNTHLNEIVLKTLHQSQGQSEEMQMLVPIARFFRIQTAPLIQQGKAVGAVAVLHDVTQLKETEQIRKEFVANVSHELKTPLTAIQSAVETLLNGALEDPKYHHQFLSAIEDDTNRLRSLIEDLLKLSKIESREIPLQKQEILLEDFFFKISETFGNVLKEKGIQLRLQLEQKVATADAEQLRHAMTNLIENAIKYNKPQGCIWIRTKKSAMDLRIEVEDTGIGIPQEALPRIFERFYRVDKARSRELAGTGLGLSIVKHVAERHGGRVEIRSELGKGSCFSLVLPF